VGFSLERAESIARDTTRASLVLTGVCMGLGALLAFMFATRLSRPLTTMVSAARAIGEGKLDTRLHFVRRDELGTLASSINEMAAGLEHSQATLHTKIAETRALYEIGQEISAQVALGPTLQLIVERARTLLQAERCLLALRQEADKGFAFQASSGTMPQELAGLRFRPGEGLSGRVVLTATPQVVDDYLEEYADSPFLDIAAMAGIRSAVAVPLRARGTVTGVLMVTSRMPRQFRSDDQQRLSALADQAAIAIENAQLYEEVRRHAAVLEAEVDARTRELQTSNARLKELDRLKSEFVSDVSHELRTPLTSIKGYIDYLLEGIVGELSLPQKDFLTRVKGNIDRLVRLINNLLDLARIEAGQVDTHPVTLAIAEVATEVLETLRPMAMGKEVDLGLDAPETGGLVRADRDQIAQVLLNLLHNAVKFTPPGGKVRVRVEAQPPGEVLTVVQDTGEGIPMEELARIFDKFHQVSPALAPTRGSGLGLTIAKKLVELHGGQLWVTSQLGQGSTFGFMLPAAGLEADG
jgi:signal transduction histidine kinase